MPFRKRNAGNQIELTIAKRIQGEWNAYTPFHMDIVNDSIDKYIAYRLLALSMICGTGWVSINGTWRIMTKA